MNARNFALFIATLMVLGQFLSVETIVPLFPLLLLIVACFTVVGSFVLLHLPPVGGYVLGEPDPPSTSTAPLPPIERGDEGG